MAEQFAQMGHIVTPEATEPEAETLQIMPANHATFAVWLECQTQWDFVPDKEGAWCKGLNYTGVRTVLDDMDAPGHVFADIRLMERAALPILNGAN